MMGYGYMAGGFYGGGFLLLHLSCLLFFLGVILFLVWAVRTLDKKQLKKWVVGLLVVGLLGVVIGSFLTPRGFHLDKDGKVTTKFYNRMMDTEDFNEMMGSFVVNDAEVKDEVAK